MNSKITFHLLTFLIFVGNLNSLFDALKYSNNLISILGFQSRKVFYYSQLISYWSEYSMSITSNLFRHERPTRNIHHQILQHLSNMNFAVCNQFTF